MLANLNKNFRQYSRGNAEFALMKINCLSVKYSFISSDVKTALVKVQLQQFTTEDQYLNKSW